MMKTTPYYIYIGKRLQAGIRKHLVAIVVPLMVSCVSSDYPSEPDCRDVTLTFSVSTNRKTTRMSSEVTQQTGVFRGIQDLWLFPYTSSTPAMSEGGSVANNDFQPYTTGSLYFLNDLSASVPDGTTHFLCYAKATKLSDPFLNGSTSPYMNDSPIEKVTSSLATSALTFRPLQIYTETVDGTTAPAVDEKATKIATYLTDIANTIPTENAVFFRKFVNEGRPVACSSKNVEKLKAWAHDVAGVDLSAITSTYDDDYPTNIDLPDGAAVVRWMKPEGEDNYRFVPQVQTTPEDNINGVNRFIYPAELYYYTYSPIKTSAESQKPNFEEDTWDEVLAHYDPDDGIMGSGVYSVAIKEPLQYAVGCLRMNLKASSSTLKDAAGDDITISGAVAATNETPAVEASFPLKAVFVSGQYNQAYDFKPSDAATDEYIIYDKTIEGDISIGGSQSTTSAFTNTLVLQSKDGDKVRFALEFENNLTSNFQGINGIVFPGTKFYLVGTIDEVSTGHTGADDYKNRAFTKGYITLGMVTISSLKQAYTYLPDLLDPRLEIGIKLVPEWIQATTTNVPL